MQFDAKKRFTSSLDQKKKETNGNYRPVLPANLEKPTYLKDFSSNINAIISNVKRKRQNSQNVIDLRRENRTKESEQKKMSFQNSVPSIFQNLGLGKGKVASGQTVNKNTFSVEKRYEKKSQSTSNLKFKQPSKIDLILQKGTRIPSRGSSLNVKLEQKMMKLEGNGATGNIFQTDSSKQVKNLQQKYTASSELVGGFKPTINLNSNFFKGTRTKQLGFAKLAGKEKLVVAVIPAKEETVAKIDGELNSFVTKVKEFKGMGKYATSGSRTKPKVTSILSNKFPSRRPYYFDEFVAAHLSESNDNYFYQLHKVSMSQTLQSLRILSQINMKSYNPSGVPVTLPPLALSSSQPPYSPPSGQTLQTIIFDLDETLIHCNEDQNGPCDLRVPVIFPTGEKIMAGINIRPHSKEVLEELASHFEVIIFTASHSCYANPVVDYFDEKKIISGRLFRENCSQVAEGLYTKDLSVIRNRDLRNVVLIDNAVYSFILNLNNGIPIIPYYHNKKDTELLKLRDFLISLKGVEDVRPIVGKYFEWETFVKHGGEPEVLFKKLFDN